MFTRLKVWWLFYCFKKGIKKSPQMMKLKKRIENCEKINKELLK